MDTEHKLWSNLWIVGLSMGRDFINFLSLGLRGVADVNYAHALRVLD